MAATEDCAKIVILKHFLLFHGDILWLYLLLKTGHGVSAGGLYLHGSKFVPVPSQSCLCPAVTHLWHTHTHTCWDSDNCVHWLIAWFSSILNLMLEIIIHICVFSESDRLSTERQIREPLWFTVCVWHGNKTADCQLSSPSISHFCTYLLKQWRKTDEIWVVKGWFVLLHCGKQIKCGLWVWSLFWTFFKAFFYMV